MFPIKIASGRCKIECATHVVTLHRLSQVQQASPSEWAAIASVLELLDSKEAAQPPGLLAITDGRVECQEVQYPDIDGFLAELEGEVSTTKQAVPNPGSVLSIFARFDEDVASAVSCHHHPAGHQAISKAAKTAKASAKCKGASKAPAAVKKETKRAASSAKSSDKVCQLMQSIKLSMSCSGVSAHQQHQRMSMCECKCRFASIV